MITDLWTTYADNQTKQSLNVSIFLDFCYS